MMSSGEANHAYNALWDAWHSPLTPGVSLLGLLGLLGCGPSEAFTTPMARTTLSPLQREAYGPPLIVQGHTAPRRRGACTRASTRATDACQSPCPGPSLRLGPWSSGGRRPRVSLWLHLR